MANFFKAKNKVSIVNKKTLPVFTVKIDRLDQNGCGVSKFQKKSLFIQGALPEEIVETRIFEQKNKYARGKLLTIKESSPDRVEAICNHFGVCGGCDIQHIRYEQQLNFKQQKVIDLFSRHGIFDVINIKDLPWQTPLVGQPWHYRRKARIGVQFNKNAQAVIGFRQKSTNQLVAIKSCPILAEPLNDIFPKLNHLISKLSVKSAIGHIEVIHSDIANSHHFVTLVIRQLKPLNTLDIQLWWDVAQQYQWQIIIDNGTELQALHSLVSTNKSASNESLQLNTLSYTLPSENPLNSIRLYFDTNDFIQINHQVNILMVEQALSWLQIKPNDIVLDLFCGLGNFSLSIAKHAFKVIGVEGVQSMVDKAQENALKNNIENCQFYQADLSKNWHEAVWAKTIFDKVLLDPARAGAEQAVMHIASLEIPMVLYVSCDPDTLARDTKALMSQGYNIVKIGLIDMFSQTKHVETMVLFERKNKSEFKA